MSDKVTITTVGHTVTITEGQSQTVSITQDDISVTITEESSQTVIVTEDPRQTVTITQDASRVINVSGDGLAYNSSTGTITFTQPVVGIDKGGTGKTTASEARTALGADNASNLTKGQVGSSLLTSVPVTTFSDVSIIDKTAGNIVYMDGANVTARDPSNWNLTDFTNDLTSGDLPAHTHAATDVTSGTFADARISESSVTQHEAALAIAASQLTSGSLSIDLIPSADRTYNIGNEDYRWNQIHADIDGAILFRAKNDSGGVLSVGDVVYISGSTGSETPDVDLADANDAAKMPAFGVISIGNTDGAEVYVTTFGSVLNVDLPSATYAVGDEVFVSTTAGEFTNTAPTGESSALQKIGYVTRVNPGGGPGGTLKVMGAGRTNAVPNLNQDKIFLGNASNQAVSTALSSINLSKFNNDLTLGANDYISQPTYTNNQVKLWYDFLNAVPDRLDHTIWWMNSGGSGVSPEESTIAGSRGAVSFLLNANNDRYTFWGPSVLTGPQEADGDEIVWESRCYFIDSLATAGAINFGLVDQLSTLNSNDQPPGTGYSGFDQVGLSIDLSQTYLQWFVKDTGSAGSPTSTDLTSYPISSYVDTWFRFGIHAKYNATNLNWDVTLYVDGTSVATTTMTFDSILTPYVGGGVGTSAGTCVVHIDWISCQYKIGGILAGRTDHVSLEDI